MDVGRTAAFAAAAAAGGVGCGKRVVDGRWRIGDDGEVVEGKEAFGVGCERRQNERPTERDRVLVYRDWDYCDGSADERGPGKVRGRVGRGRHAPHQARGR